MCGWGKSKNKAMNASDKITQLVRELEDRQFFGDLIFTFQRGELTTIRRNEVLKPAELDSANRDLRGHRGNDGRDK